MGHDALAHHSFEDGTAGIDFNPLQSTCANNFSKSKFLGPRPDSTKSGTVSLTSTASQEVSCRARARHRLNSPGSLLHGRPGGRHCCSSQKPASSQTDTPSQRLLDGSPIRALLFILSRVVWFDSGYMYVRNDLWLFCFGDSLARSHYVTNELTILRGRWSDVSRMELDMSRAVLGSFVHPEASILL